MALQRRVAPKPEPTPGVNFLDTDFYTAGGTLPEGNYIAADHSLEMYDFPKQDGRRSPARLCVMISFIPLEEPTADPYIKAYSLGGKAHENFAPNPENGKTLLPVAGSQVTSLNQMSNWAIYLKSLYDSGLPKGTASNDLASLDGMWVHITNIPEPEERKQFQTVAKTGEAAAEEPRRSNTIPVVTEILDEGKPWEGSGGIPKGPVKVKTGAGVKGNGKAAVAAAAAEAEAEEEPAAEADEDAESVATNVLSSILEGMPDGATKVALKTTAFKNAKAKHGEALAQKIAEILRTDDGLNAVLAPLGFVVDKLKVVPA